MKMIKKIFVLVTAISVCMLFYSAVYAKDISETYDSAYQYATEILTEYYEAIDQYKEEDFSDNISSAGLL